MDIQFTNKISVKDYNFLRSSVGWREIEAAQAKTGLKNSAFICAATLDRKTVGLARVISDGGYIAYIADVIVHPDYQNLSIGARIMERVMNYIEGTVGEGQFVFANLMAARGKEGFYEKFGFIRRPNDELGCGMTQNISRR